MIDWRARAEAIGAQFGLPFFAKQIEAESGFDPNAISPAGAEGIAQFMPATAASHGINPWDPEAALQEAAKYDVQLKKKYGHDDLVLAAYNAGEGAVEQYGGNVPPYPETIGYIARILGVGVRDVQPIGGPAPGPTGAAGPSTSSGADSCITGLIGDAGIGGWFWNKCTGRPEYHPEIKGLVEQVGAAASGAVQRGVDQVAPAAQGFLQGAELGAAQIGISLVVIVGILAIGAYGLRETVSG